MPKYGFCSCLRDCTVYVVLYLHERHRLRETIVYVVFYLCERHKLRLFRSLKCLDPKLKPEGKKYILNPQN